MAKEKVQFSVSEIDNGLLVQFPGEQRNGVIIREAEVHHCTDFEEFIEYIKPMIPQRLKSKIIAATAGLISPRGENG